MTNNKLKQEINNYLTEAGLPGVGYAVNWEKVTDQILSIIYKEVIEALPEIPHSTSKIYEMGASDYKQQTHSAIYKLFLTNLGGGEVK